MHSHPVSLLLDGGVDGPLLLVDLGLALWRAGNALLQVELGEDARVEGLLGRAAGLEVLRWVSAGARGGLGLGDGELGDVVVLGGG